MKNHQITHKDFLDQQYELKQVIASSGRKRLYIQVDISKNLPKTTFVVCNEVKTVKTRFISVAIAAYNEMEE